MEKTLKVRGAGKHSKESANCSACFSPKLLKKLRKNCQSTAILTTLTLMWKTRFNFQKRCKQGLLAVTPANPTIDGQVWVLFICACMPSICARHWSRHTCVCLTADNLSATMCSCLCECWCVCLSFHRNLCVPGETPAAVVALWDWVGVAGSGRGRRVAADVNCQALCLVH